MDPKTEPLTRALSFLANVLQGDSVDDYVDLVRLAYLNGREAGLDEVQENINRARRKYFDVGEIQLKLDRRQAALDQVRKEIMDDKGKILSPN
jgi:hypothetical protein